MEDAKMEYTRIMDDPAFYHPDFILAFSYRLAYLIAPRIAKGDPFGMGRQAFELYQAEVTRARASAVNEQQDRQVPDAEFDRVRPSDYDDGVHRRWRR